MAAEDAKGKVRLDEWVALVAKACPDVTVADVGG